MDLHVLALVLLAAAAHAAWNAWLKDSGDRLSSMAALAIGWLIVGCISIPIVGIPSVASWPYLLPTTIVHTGYAMFLITAYKYAEFSLAYPIARGTGPLLVALAAPFVVSEYLQGPSFFAVTLIVVGVFLIGVFSNERSLGGSRAILFSLATGVLIAAYTMIDGQGGRAGSTPHAYAGCSSPRDRYLICSSCELGRARRKVASVALAGGHDNRGRPDTGPVIGLTPRAFW